MGVIKLFIKVDKMGDTNVSCHLIGAWNSVCMLTSGEDVQEGYQWHQKKKQCLFVCVDPVNPMGSCRARSVYLTTRLLGRLSPLCGQPVLCTFFRLKLTTALLESAEGREWPYKIFHDQSPRKNVADPDGGWTRDLLVSIRTAHPTKPPRLAQKKTVNQLWRILHT